MRQGFSLLLFFLLSLGSVAFAQPAAESPLPRSMRLEYTGAEQCPDASFFRDRVVLKRPSHADPFVASSSARLTVLLHRDASGYRGSWEASNASGAVVRKHELGPVITCVDLVDGLAFGFVLRFDDRSVPVQTPVPHPAPPPMAIVPAPLVPVEQPHSPPPAPPPGRFLVAASGLAGFATAPAPAGGGVLALGWRAPWWSISGELRALLALDAPASGGYHVSLHRVTGALVPCLHWRWLLGCGALELGELGGSSNAEAPASGSAFIGTLGGRIGVEIPLGSFLALRAAVDGFGVFKPVIVRIGGEPRWQMPAGGALAAAGFVAFF